MEIRPARREDVPAIVGLMDLLARFEKLPGPAPEVVARMTTHAFDEGRLELWVADDDGRVLAYAALFPTYSTFLARPTLFLEDLFVHPDARRRGIATAMLERLRAEAVARGCGRFEWLVLDWNADAIALYERLGARRHGDWRLYRVEL